MSGAWQDQPPWQDQFERRPRNFAKALAPLPAGPLKLHDLTRPSTNPGALGIPIPSCWGSRGSPWSLRCLTIGGPAQPVELRQKSQPFERKPEPKRFDSYQPNIQRKMGHATPSKVRTKCIGAPPSISRDGSTLSMRRGVSTASITASSSWRAPEYLGPRDQEQLGELFRVLREEFVACDTQKEVEQVNRTASKIISEGHSTHFCTTGRLACRLREAARSTSCSSNFASMGCRHQLATRKILRCEMKRRVAEIAGWGEKEAELIALAPDMNEQELRDCSNADPHFLSKSPIPAPPSSAPPSSRPRSRHQVSGRSGVENVSSPVRVSADSSLQGEEANQRAGQFISSELGRTKDPTVSFEDVAEENVSSTQYKDRRSVVSRSSQGSRTSSGSARSKRSMASKLSTYSNLQERARMSLRTSIISVGNGWKDETKLMKVYNSLRDDWGLHHDDVYKALELVGLLKPRQHLIDEAFYGLTRYVNIEQDKWIKFVGVYIGLQHQAIAEAFVECDTDRSGEVEVPELIKLMKEFNIEPMPHVLQEVLDEVDKDGSSSLDLQEFEAVMHVLHVREGFTKSECEEFDTLFRKYDRDQSGEIDVTEMMAIVFYLGFAFDEEMVNNIVKQVDIDGSGMLNQTEFLTCMRKLREKELARLRKAIADNDLDGNGLVAGEELKELMGGLACNVDMDVMREVAKQVGVEAELASQGVNLEQLWQILVVYRSREGFSKHENKDIKGAFKRFDVSRSGELSTAAVGRVLRWLGYTPTYEQQQSLVAKVDVDGSGNLNATEFRKLVRMLQAKELDAVRDAFREREKSRLGSISKDLATFALRAAGCIDMRGLTPRVRPEDTEMIDGRAEVTLESFIRIAMSFHKERRRAFRDNMGFAAQEVIEMQKSFNNFDTDHSGEISQGELQRLIQEMLPRLANDTAMRPKLLELLAEIDADGSGTINFEDFVRLMQEIHQMKVIERFAREQIVVAETGFSVKEVEEFRDLFVAADEDDGKSDDFLTFFKLKSMLHAIVPLGDKNLTELKSVLKVVLDVENLDGLYCGVTFPQFLVLMRKLLDIDFGGLKAKLASDVDSS